MFPWYKKIYNFNIKLNYNVKTWKNQTSNTLVMVRVIVTTPLVIIVDYNNKSFTNKKQVVFVVSIKETQLIFSSTKNAIFFPNDA